MPQVDLPTLTSQQRAQLQTWIAGLDVWIAEEGSKPENNIATANDGGLTALEEQTAERNMYQFALDNEGQRVHTNQFHAHWLIAFELIRDSYNAAVEHEYLIKQDNPGLGTMRRSVMRDLFDAVLVLHGRPSDKPTLPARKDTTGG